MSSKKTNIILIMSLALVLIIIGSLLNPIPQPQVYHHFANQRGWLSITNFQDVLSNIFFALVGFWGVYLFSLSGEVDFIDRRERWFWLGIAIGLILTALGSAYYHLAPDNTRLVWDRLPMTIVFMTIVAAFIGERISVSLSLYLWPLLILFGFYSVFYWYFSEQQGAGDLRIYLGVQLFTIFVILIMMLTTSPYTRTWDLGFVILFFGLARLCEMYDHQIFMFTQGVVSGHTLKHLAAAIGGLWLIRMAWKRKIVQREI